MAVAAILILFFHLWIPVFKYGTIWSQVERFILGISYIGVDMFFFVSAYVLTLRPIEDFDGYKKFILNRSLKLLPLYIIAYVFGHFLWFIPAIWVTYILFTPYFRLAGKRPTLCFAIAMAIWALASAALLLFVNKGQDLGIYLMRIPSILLGSFWAAFDGKMSKMAKLISGLLLTAVGIFISFNYGYMDKLDVPFKDTFYLTGIPLMLGILMLIDFAAEFARPRPLEPGLLEARLHEANPKTSGARLRPLDARPLGANTKPSKARPRPLELIGGISLELYFTQVVLGTLLVNTFFSLLSSRLLTNIATLSITFIVSILINRSVALIEKQP